MVLAAWQCSSVKLLVVPPLAQETMWPGFAARPRNWASWTIWFSPILSRWLAAGHIRAKERVTAQAVREL
jgi:hypothetical protein